MNLKVLKFIDVFIIFGLCFITHFIYEWFSNTLFSIFFPVNESIWEHLKMLYSAIIICGFFDWLILKIFRIKFNNFFISLFLTSFISILLFLILYVPLFYIFGNSLFLNITVLIVVIIVSQFISYFIYISKNYGYLNYISLIGIVFVYIIFGILTYYPFFNDVFYDFSKDKYGINIYDI